MQNLSDFIASGTGGGGEIIAVTANHTASAGEFLLADTSGGAFTITLPAAPATGDRLVIADPANNWAIASVTVARNGATIEGVAENLILNVSAANVALIYTGTTWRAYTEARGASGTAATLDGAETLTGKTIHGNANTITVDGVNSPGYRTAPINDPTGSYSLQASDSGKVITADSQVIIPNGVFAAGDVVSIWNSTASFIDLTCNIGTAYVAGVDANSGIITLATKGIATVLFISGSECVVTGNVA